jgi:hypothetical protein
MVGRGRGGRGGGRETAARTEQEPHNLASGYPIAATLFVLTLNRQAQSFPGSSEDRCENPSLFQ